MKFISKYMKNPPSQHGNQSTRRRTNSPTPTRRHIKSSRDVASWSSIQYNLLEVKHTEK